MQLSLKQVCLPDQANVGQIGALIDHGLQSRTGALIDHKSQSRGDRGNATLLFSQIRFRGWSVKAGYPC
jgi:hypothetical protein